MILRYSFSYNVYDVEGVIAVDTEKFTKEKAQEFLDFFDWDFNRKNDPIEEAVKKYCQLCVKLGVGGLGRIQVEKEISELEGYFPMGENTGIHLEDLDVEPFNWENLNFEYVVQKD